MAKIQSDASVASDLATGIQSGASGITAVTAPTKDSSSDYSGNTDAASHIDNELMYSGQIAGKINEFIGLIHSTASEFEAMDQKLNQEIASNTKNTLVATESPIISNPDFQPKYGLF
ncbi:TIGR04197 family type VII secretion effector [Streptococcus iniae]|nr:TIGR04197 family type VII secretion effector [Streptococcus iniae]